MTENDVRPVDANELLKQSIYCKGEDGSMLYAVPISCIFAAPTLKPEDVTPVCGYMMGDATNG